MTPRWNQSKSRQWGQVGGKWYQWSQPKSSGWVKSARPSGWQVIPMKSAEVTWVGQVSANESGSKWDQIIPCENERDQTISSHTVPYLRSAYLLCIVLAASRYISISLPIVILMWALDVSPYVWSHNARQVTCIVSAMTSLLPSRFAGSQLPWLLHREVWCATHNIGACDVCVCRVYDGSTGRAHPSTKVPPICVARPGSHRNAKGRHAHLSISKLGFGAQRSHNKMNIDLAETHVARLCGMALIFTPASLPSEHVKRPWLYKS